MKKLFLFLSLWMLVSCQQKTKLNDYKLFVTLENAPFDSLYLLDYTSGRKVFLPGEKIDKSTWEITIPDSIALNSASMLLQVSKYNIINKSSRKVRFVSEKNGRKAVFADVGIEDRENYIHATYIDKTIISDNDFSIKIGGKDSILSGDLILENFKLILKNNNSDVTIRAQDPLFSWFPNFNDEEVSYDEYMKRYVDLSKKYPDSRYLISNLSRMLARYKSKNDVQSIYDNLSDKHKKSLWAERIERYILFYTKFPNSSLPTSDTKNCEEVIQDTSKYNLIAFTASWCGPCIEEIPILKKIHKDLNKRLILTYISLDEEDTVSSFQKLIHEKNIPWRTLFAFQNTKKIENEYFIDGIPHCILVYPNGEVENIEVRDDEQLKRLYLLCNKQSTKS